MADDDKPQPQRSRTPDSEVFKAFMSDNWAESRVAARPISDLAAQAARRRVKLADALPDTTMIIPAGAMKQRSNDTDYPYRPHTAFSYLTGWGADTTPDSLLLIQPGQSPVLYARGPAGRDSDEFYANPALGEFWTGPRPHLEDIASQLGLRVVDFTQFDLATLEGSAPLAIIREADPALTARVDALRLVTEATQADDLLAQVVSEMRLVKDEAEIAQMRLAIEATARGFTDILRSLPDATDHPRGERVVEGVFHQRARVEGNDVGYGTIAASGAHACILHWVRNDGTVRRGDLLLVDAGVELDSLYTADITRTIPVGGRFTPIQRQVYEAVLSAADRAFAIVKPGITFRSIHDEAMVAISEALEGWGFLPVSAEKSREPEAGYHRRYMIHGTSHHLGLDVHDCAQARKEMYLDGIVQPGMVFTIEPGLYFQPDDLTVPAEWRGIGVRIEDNILVTPDGAVNLSAFIPRTVDDVEAWWAREVGAPVTASQQSAL